MEYLSTFTEHSKEKVFKGFQLIGSPITMESINHNNRGIVRSFLSGLGIPSKYVQDLPVQTLEECYKDLFRSSEYKSIDGLHTLYLKMNVDKSDMNALSSEIHQRAIQATYHSSELPTIRKAMADNIMDDNKKDIDIPDNPEPKQDVQDVPSRDTGNTGNDVQDALLALQKALQGKQSQQPTIDESRIIELIKQHSTATAINITYEHKDVKVDGLHHKDFEKVLKAVQCKCNVMLVGAAGSGKTTLAEQIAKALEVPFFFNGALASEYKLTGFVDANGKIVDTAFKDAYKNGGLYLFDEIDGSMPDALLAFNAALSNGQADFPEGMIKKHESFYCIAAANTYGRGADRVYVGRSQLDGASLDRFVMIDLDYDEKLERALAGNDNWVDYVQAVRKEIYKQGMRHIVSPRASMDGAKLLKAGLERQDVENMTVWKGLDQDSVKKIKRAMV